ELAGRRGVAAYLRRGPGARRGPAVVGGEPPEPKPNPIAVNGPGAEGSAPYACVPTGASLWTWRWTMASATIRYPSHDCSMQKFYSRTHPRWRSYDYMQPGVYFVTTITHGRSPLLGAPTRHGIVLTQTGNTAHRCWLMVPARFDGVLIDRFVVMPDHVHAIVVLLRT